MKRRLVATLLVLSAARAARADEPHAPAVTPAPPPAETAPPASEPATTEAAPPASAPAATEVAPLDAVPAPPLLPPAVGPLAPVASLGVTPLPAPPLARGGAAPLVAGALTMFVPFVVGCALWSSSTDDARERAGTYVMAAGFAAAPWVSHGVEGRWKRGAIFGSVSTALSAATLVAMEAKDPFYAPFANRQRVPFGVFLTTAMFAGALGVVDSFLAAPAREAR